MIAESSTGKNFPASTNIYKSVWLAVIGKYLYLEEFGDFVQQFCNDIH